MQNKLIILDRDGVINHDSDEYIKSPEEWIPIKGSLEAIAAWNKAGYHITIATNQSGIGRGYYTQATLQAMHHKMQRLLATLGGHIDHIEYCPHRPDAQCLCRKPKAGMLTNIVDKFAVNPKNSVMVGDTIGDYQAAMAAGIAFVLVTTGKGKRTLASGQLPQHIPHYNDLAAYTHHSLKKAFLKKNPLNEK